MFMYYLMFKNLNIVVNVGLIINSNPLKGWYVGLSLYNQ